MTIFRIAPFLILAAACTETADSVPDTAELPHDRLEMDTPPSADNPAYEFGAIGGMVLLPDGRIAVADIMAHEVRVFAADGAHVFTFGRKGGGPGELEGPCCLALDSRGRLWVRDGGNARYDIFEIVDDSAVYLTQVRMAHGDVNRWVPVTFDRDGNVIDIGSRSDRTTGVTRTVRFHVDSAGAIVREVVIHDVPDDSTSVKEVQRAIEGGTMTMYAYQPYGPSELVAHSPTGEFAHAISSRYAIDWRDAEGRIIRSVIGTVDQGPPLSDDERSRAEEGLNEIATSMGVSRAALGFGVPSNKTPLRDLFFDREGRLWVELSVPQGSPRRADVYGTDGTLERTVEWPASVDLSDGAILGDVAWGLHRDSFDAQRPVRLRGLR